VSDNDQAITTPLSAEECAALAREIAADSTLWQEHVKHEASSRHFHRLELNERYEVYVISWMDDADTGFHDHDVSAGGVHVVEGGIFEERLGFGTGHLERLVGPGETITFAPSYIHRFRPKDGIPTVSIHVYSPPLRTMGAYHEGPDGALIRTPIDGEAELVNLDA
jgi:mannose-6-phosphate isomerase-like protein (cupin superfamily)